MPSCEQSEPNYRTWVKAALGLSYVRSSLVHFVEKKVGVHNHCCLLNDKNGTHALAKIKKMDHDQICKLRMLRNNIVHSSTMKLSEHDYQQHIDHLKRFASKEDVEMIEKLDKQKDVTLLEEFHACKMAEKWRDENARDIGQLVDDIYESEPMKKNKIVLQGKESSCLKQLKHNTDYLLIRAQALDDNDPTMTEQVKEIRQLLRRIEIDLDNLENAQQNQQRKLISVMLKILQSPQCVENCQDDTDIVPTTKTFSNPIYNHVGYLTGSWYCKPMENELRCLMNDIFPCCILSQVSGFSLYPYSHGKYDLLCRQSRLPFNIMKSGLSEWPYWSYYMEVIQEQEKECSAVHSCMIREKSCYKMLHNTEWVEYYTSRYDVIKQLQLYYEQDIHVEHLLLEDIFLLIDEQQNFELELKHINCAYICALTRGKTISEKILDAWLNRLISRSLHNKDTTNDFPDKEKTCEIKLKVTSDNDDLSQDIKSDLSPAVCVREHFNTNHAQESEGDTIEHLYPQATRVSSDTHQSNENKSLVTINQRHQDNCVTVDLKFHHDFFQSEDSDKSLDKGGKENDSLKDIVCHGNRMLPRDSDITVFPAIGSGNGNDNSEQVVETNISLNDNDQSSVTDRNSSSFREQSMPNEEISSCNSESVFVDGHSLHRQASGVAGSDGISGAVLQPSDLKGNSQEHCPQLAAEPEVQLVGKTENSGENTPTVPSHISDSGNVAGIPASDLPNPEVDQSEIQMFEPLMQIIDKIADGERVPPQITMRYEMLRFCTLRSFPKHNKPYITRLAAAGFYYANTDDEVVCYSCARRKRNWREDDNPMEIHRELNPNCSFLLRNLEVNVPVRMSEVHRDSTRVTHSQSLPNAHHANTSSTSSTVCNNHNTDTTSSQARFITCNSSENITQTVSSPVTSISSTANSTNNTLLQTPRQQRAHGNFVQTIMPSSHSVEQERQSSRMTVSGSSHDTPTVNSSSAMPTSQLSAGGANTSTAPKYPKYATKTARLTSFNDCGDIVIPPDSLATSGFFYAGFGDCVRCFQCGVGLRHWSDEDDPWIEHSRWSKDCSFVKQVKGQEFVNLVQMAVQYSQNQNGNGQNVNGNTAASNLQSPEDAAIEQQMHTNAAQSVLEMGYDPDVIRNALRALRNANDGQTLSATTLMEKIFALEDEESNSLENNQAVHQTPQSQSNTRSAQNTPTNNTQRISLCTSSASSNDVRTQSAASDDASSAAGSGSLKQGTSSVQSKKLQLLEQKKLQQENEQLKQQSLCTKCRTNDVCIVFLPCGHLVTCETCAPTIKYCSVQDCGKYIKGTVRTYLA